MSGEQLLSDAKNGYLISVQRLLNQNISVDYRDKYGITALINAAHNGHLTVVQELIKAGATIDFQNHLGNTALINAANNGHLTVVQELIKAGSSLDIQNNNGQTALMLAVWFNYLEVVRELIKAGADLDIQDLWGKTASYSRNKEIYILIIESQREKRENLRYQVIEKNIKKLKDLQANKHTYISNIPKDIIGIINDYLLNVES